MDAGTFQLFRLYELTDTFIYEAGEHFSAIRNCTDQCIFTGLRVYMHRSAILWALCNLKEHKSTKNPYLTLFDRGKYKWFCKKFL
jgi:hypothetical protein